MNNQTVQDFLKKTIRTEDGFVIRAAKCIGAFMEHGPSYVEDEKIEIQSMIMAKGTEHEHLALVVKTDIFEFIDVLLESFVNSVEPFGDGSTDISLEHGDEDLRYLCRVYEREKAKGLDTGYAMLTFLIDRNSTQVKLETTGEFELTVGNLDWIGALFM
jgi:hypothetical protein